MLKKSSHIFYWFGEMCKKKDLIALFSIIIFVILGNFVYISGFRDPNPALQHILLSTSSSSRIIQGIDTLDPNNGFTSQALGSAASNQLNNFNLPYWNHFEGIGAPLLAGMQSAALFLPFIFLLSFENGLFIIHILLEIIAGFFTYLFLKRIGLRSRYALIGGLAFSLNGTFSWLTNAAFNPIAFLPMILYGVEKSLGNTKSNKRNGWLFITLGISLSLYAGFPETAFLNGLFVLGWSLCRMFSLASTLRFVFFRKLFIGAFTGIIIATPALITFAVYLTESYIGGHDNSFATLALGNESIPALFMPYIYGAIGYINQLGNYSGMQYHWGSVGGYFTFSLLILGVYGLFNNKLNRALKYFIVFWIIVSGLKMFGFDLAELIWNLVPTVKNAAFFRYIIPSIYFALVILATFGIQKISEDKVSLKQNIIVLILFLAFFFINLYILEDIFSDIKKDDLLLLFAISSILLALVIFLITYLSNLVIIKKYRYIIISSLIVIEVLVFFTIPQLSTPKVLIDYGPINYLKQNLGFNRYYTLGPIAPNYGSKYEIASINQNNLPVPRKWSEYIVSKLDRNTDPILFVGYFRLSKSGPSAYEEFINNISNFKYVGAKYLVTKPNEINILQDDSSNLLSKVYSSDVADIYLINNYSQYFEVSDGCVINSFEDRNLLSAKCQGPGGYLIRKELNISGWSASINGQSIDIGEDRERIFQKITLEPGLNVVKFSYNPKYINIAYLMLIIGILVIIINYIPLRKILFIIKGRLRSINERK